MEFALNLISIEKIVALPLLLSGPWMFVILLFLVRSLRSIFSLRLITAAMSLMYAFALTVILSHLGMTIAEFLGLEDTVVKSSQYLLHNGHQRLS
jgi:hypothetical protein